MNPWWMVPLWGVLGALVGVPLSRLTQASLAAPDRDHPLTTAITICSATAVLFGLTAAVEDNAAAMLRACAGMTILITFYLLIALTARGALGAADVRLAGLLGLALAWQGWTTFLAGALLGLGYGALTGATMIFLRRACCSDRGSLHRPAHPPRMITRGAMCGQGAPSSSPLRVSVAQWSLAWRVRPGEH